MGSISSVMWTSPYNNLWYYCFEYTHNFTLHQTTWKLKLNVDGQNEGEPNTRWGECRLTINGALMHNESAKQLKANSLLAQGIITGVPNSNNTGQFTVSLDGYIQTYDCWRGFSIQTVKVDSKTDYPNGANICFEQHSIASSNYPNDRDLQDKVTIRIKYPPSGRNCTNWHSVLFWTSNNKQPKDTTPYTYKWHSDRGLKVTDDSFTQYVHLFPKGCITYDNIGDTLKIYNDKSRAYGRLAENCECVYAVNYRNTSCGSNNVCSIGGHIGHWYHKYPDPVDRTTVRYEPVNDDDYIRDSNGNIIGLPLDCPMRIWWKAPKAGNDNSPITKYRLRFCRVAKDIEESLYAQVFAAISIANDTKRTDGYGNGYIDETHANYLNPVLMDTLSESDDPYYASLIDYPAPTPDKDGYVYFEFIPEDLGFKEDDLFFMGIYSCHEDPNYDRIFWSGHGWTISQVWCPLTNYRLMSGGKMSVKTQDGTWKSGRTYVKKDNKWVRANEVFVKTYGDYIVSSAQFTEWKIKPVVDEVNKTISFKAYIRKTDSQGPDVNSKFNIKLQLCNPDDSILDTNNTEVTIGLMGKFTDWLELNSDLLQIQYEGDTPPPYKIKFKADSENGRNTPGDKYNWATSGLYPMWIESL